MLVGVGVTLPEERALLDSLMRGHGGEVPAALVAGSLPADAEAWGMPVLSELAVQVRQQSLIMHVHS